LDYFLYKQTIYFLTNPDLFAMCYQLRKNSSLNKRECSATGIRPVQTRLPVHSGFASQKKSPFRSSDCHGVATHMSAPLQPLPQSRAHPMAGRTAPHPPRAGTTLDDCDRVSSGAGVAATRPPPMATSRRWRTAGGPRRCCTNRLHAAADLCVGIKLRNDERPFV
jgi:hypothetical protein